VEPWEVILFFVGTVLAIWVLAGGVLWLRRGHHDADAIWEQVILLAIILVAAAGTYRRCCHESGPAAASLTSGQYRDHRGAFVGVVILALKRDE
jgi:hypothetical protein